MKVSKKVIIPLTIGIIGLNLVGCGVGKYHNNLDSTASEIKINNRFQITNEYYYIGEDKYSVAVDTKTKNLYLYNSTKTYINYVPNLVPLYDENGNIAKAK